MSIAKFYFIIVCAFLLVCFVMNKSISAYLDQRYHIYFFPQGEVLNEANGFLMKLEQIKEVLFNSQESLNDGTLEGNFTRNLNENLGENLAVNLSVNSGNLKSNLGENLGENSAVNLSENSNPNSANLAVNSPNLNSTQNPNLAVNLAANSTQNLNQNPANLATNSTLNSNENLNPNPANSPQISPLNAKEIIKKLDVKNGEEFLLIGDSMMQGVAVALVKDLKKLGIKSTNLSRQNTGLSYKSYFNWAKAIENSLANNANIKYLAVLLGANDPWDLKEKGKFYSFKSDEWREIYATRVDEIMQIAQNYGVRVFWYEVPPVRRELLNEKIQVLNEIYKNEALGNGEIFISTADAMSGGVAYSSYIKDENNKSVKVRADDGVHFNPRGAKIMSSLLLRHLKQLENGAE